MRCCYDQIGMKIMPYINLFLDTVDKDIDLASGQKKVIATLKSGDTCKGITFTLPP